MRRFIATVTRWLLDNGPVREVISDLLRNRERESRAIALLRTLSSNPS
ncbi:hypothetical protein LBMAG56_05660 [Verrucomicrobiota bacterium]|nr:hypothetical protein LBMAG56_05660 [Verrucomicrobiota bacterium]